MGEICFIVAMAGLAAFLHTRMELPSAFCPAVTICGQILVLYVLSLLGLLWYGPCLLVLSGVLGLAWSLVRKRERLIELLSPGVVAFCVYAGILWVLNAGTTPDGFDNYSHWALAAKELYLTHALPGQDTLVTMTNYPPAAPLYEYFILRMVGFSESAMLGANGLFMGALLVCGFGDCGWKDWNRWPICIGLMAALTLVIPNCSANLQVDALLGMMTLAMGVIALWDASKTLPAQGILGMVLVLTKMSGAVLLALHCGLLLFLWRKSTGSWRAFAHGAIYCVVLPALAYGAFHLRIHWVFADTLARNQFQVGVAAFGELLGKKTAAFWASFPRDFWYAIWNGETVASMFFLVGNGVLAVVLVLCALKVLPLPNGMVGLVLLSWVGLAVYTVSLVGMYIFMMEEHESIILASFYRYFGTGVLYQLGLCLFGLHMDKTEAKGQGLPVFLCLAAFMVPCVQTQAPLSDWEASSRDARENLRQAVLENREQVSLSWDGETMLYCVVDQTHLNEDYVYRFVRYAFYSRHVRPMGPSLTRMDDLAEGTSCYILWVEDDAWAAQTLTDAGLDVPEIPGLYYKDKDLTLLRMET